MYVNARSAFSSFSSADIIPESQLNRIRIKECGEPLVELNSSRIIVCKTARRTKFDGDDKLYAREGVRQRLEMVCDILPSGLMLKIFDAYRPYEFQKALFDEEYEKDKESESQ